MGLKSSFELMSAYNQWINNRLYQTAAELGDEKINEDQGAFFRSVIGTLNHVLVGDILWLKRFARHPKRYRALSYVEGLDEPKALDQILHGELSTLSEARRKVDESVIDWCREVEESDWETSLTYSNTKGVRSTRNFGHLVLHFFNHQTHHRGQITTLLTQNGIDIGVTDLLGLVRDESNPA